MQLYGGINGDELQITHAASGSVIDGGAGSDLLIGKDGVAETISCGASKTNAARADYAHDLVVRRPHARQGALL